MNVKEYVRLRKKELDKFESFWLEMQKTEKHYAEELEKSSWSEQESIFTEVDSEGLIAPSWEILDEVSFAGSERLVRDG